MGKSTEPLKTRQYVTAETLTIVLKKVYRHWPAGATCKLLFIKHLTEIRVVVFATLKMLNILTHNQLRGAHHQSLKRFDMKGAYYRLFLVLLLK